MAQFRITGIKEIDKALAELEAKVAKKVIRQAMRAALKPVKDAVKANAPVNTGELKAAVKIKTAKRRKNTLRLDVVIGEGDFTGKQFYASFIEYGAPGHNIEARGFMKAAFEKTAERAKQIAEQTIREGIEREAKKS